jgi:hypothetical protein
MFDKHPVQDNSFSSSLVKIALNVIMREYKFANGTLVLFLFVIINLFVQKPKKGFLAPSLCQFDKKHVNIILDAEIGFFQRCQYLTPRNKIDFLHKK